MKGLRTELGVLRVGIKKWYTLQKYKLTRDLVYDSHDGVTIIVPAGFITNFATWIKPRGRYEVAAVIHDYLYTLQGRTKFGTNRHHADRIFNEAMRRGGCSRTRVHVMYYGVRLFGWWAYYKGGHHGN